MPTYTFTCVAGHDQILFLPMSARNDPILCGLCEQTYENPVWLRRLRDAPTVMNAAYPDGTRRFDDLRRIRNLEREIKAETDKKRIDRLKADQQKVSKE